MCGICGIIDLDNRWPLSEREAAVTAMNQAILHRGPDSAGLHSHQNSTLAMRRLAIIDEVGGKQPFFNQRRDIVIVFNGEIYNFPELKQQLMQKGHTFQSNSDTEVLVQLYEAHGADMLPMLKGMFAFCICDKRTNTYLMARDPFGEKPFYYHWDNKVFSFSSEITSLLQHQQVPRRLNLEALPYYFRTSLVPEPMTLLDNIKSLSPGCYLQLSEEGLQERCYFSPKYEAEPTITSEEEALELLRPLLTNAVRRQRISDVPIGAFLSGGIDSSAVTALLQKSSAQPVQTFHVRFEQQDFDESDIARKVAAHCGTEHHEITIPNLDFDADIFWTIIDHVGLPFRDSSAIPTFLITKAISERVKVALSGDGGDELFGGYALFDWYQKINRFKQIPAPFRTVLNSGLGLSQQLPLLHQSALIRQLKRGVSTSLLAEADIPIALNEMFSEGEVRQLLNGKIAHQENGYTLLQEYPEEYKHWSPLRKIMYYRLKYTLPSNMLIKVDRMSMANSLEVRAPFLDPDLFTASCKLSDDLLMRNGQGKYILRKLLATELPAEVFTHPKHGFNMPLQQYQNKAFLDLAQQLLFEENPWPGFIPQKTLEGIYQRGINTRKDNADRSVFQTAHQLWMMMQLLGWAKRFSIQL